MNNDINEKIVHAAPVPPFVRFVASAVPMVFDNSLSYYEALCALWKWIQDDVIDVINHNANVTEEYIKLVNDLKEYVDNYFANLDVQEEINNKLDKMAEDGTLQEIISIYLQTTAVWGFDTVADMISSNNLTDGSYARTLGYYEKSDGGGSLYKIRNVAEGDNPDGMLLISLSDTLVAEFVIEDKISSKQLGLLGDGTTDETTKLNTFFGIQTNVDKILNRGVYVASSQINIKGTWRQTSGNNVAPKITFDNASIKYTGTENACSILVYGMFKYLVENLSLTQDSVRSYVKMAGCWSTEFTNMTIHNLKLQATNADMDNLTAPTYSLEYLKFNNCLFQGTVYIDSSESYFINVLTFDNCWLAGSSQDYNVQIDSSKHLQNITFNNCDLSYANTAVFNVAQEQAQRGYINCNNCYFDSAKPLYRDNEQNKMQFNYTQCMLAPNSQVEYYNLYPSDYMRNTAIGGYGSHAFNLPTFNVNLAKNGNFESESLITGYAPYVINSASTANWTKEWVESNKGMYGRARKVTALVTTHNLRLQVRAGTTAPWDGEYTFAIRMKVLSCSNDCTFNTYFCGVYMGVKVSDYVGKEIVIVNNRKSASYGVTEGTDLLTDLYVSDPTDFVAEIYEVSIVPGKMYIPNAPLHGLAKMES